MGRALPIEEIRLEGPRPSKPGAERRRPGTHPQKNPHLRETPAVEQRKPPIEERGAKPERFAPRFFRSRSAALREAYNSHPFQGDKPSSFSYTRSVYHGLKVVNSLYRDYFPVLKRSIVPRQAADFQNLFEIGQQMRVYQAAYFTLDFFKRLTAIRSNERLLFDRSGNEATEAMFKSFSAALVQIIQFYEKALERIGRTARQSAIDAILAKKRAEAALEELIAELKVILRKLELRDCCKMQVAEAFRPPFPYGDLKVAATFFHYATAPLKSALTIAA